MTAVAKLPEKWREEAADHDRHKDPLPASILRECADELEAALPPAELGGVEKRARELLAAEMREFYPSTADRLVDQGIPAESFPHSTEAAIRAIASALSTPRAAEAVTEDRVDVALAAYNRADYQWTQRANDDRDEPRHRFAMRAAIEALTPPSAKGEL